MTEQLVPLKSKCRCFRVNECGMKRNRKIFQREWIQGRTFSRAVVKTTKKSKRTESFSKYDIMRKLEELKK